MEDILIPMTLLLKNDLSINEYLVLYDIANHYKISNMIDNRNSSVLSLEKKGFVKMIGNEVFLRDKAKKIFSLDEDLFVEWLKIYPVSVKNKFGGKRALSPSSPNTILGRKLKKKWKSTFRRDLEAQKKAILVLKAEIKSKTRSGDLEYMVEATRWLNEGYHEKHDFLLEEDKENSYTNEDYM